MTDKETKEITITLTEVLLALSTLFLAWTASQVHLLAQEVSAIKQQQIDQDRRIEHLETS